MKRIHKYSQEQNLQRLQFEPLLEQQQQDGPPVVEPQQQQQQQQQADPNQQQQQQAPVDPFASIDMDMLDDKTRAEIDKAKTQFATIANARTEAERQAQIAQQQARDFQSRHDQLLQQQKPNQQQQQQQPVTTNDKLEKFYISKGLTPEVAKKSAEIMSGAFEVFGADFEQKLGTAMAPVIGSTLTNQATQAFQQVVQNDRTGAMANPEIAQKVWESVNQLTGTGQLVDADLIQNLKRVHMGAMIEEGKFNPAAHQQQQTSPVLQQLQIPPMSQIPMQQQPPFIPHQQMQTRFTFPGAGNAPRTTNGNGNHVGSVLDAETAAAVAATTASWTITSKGKR